MDSSNPDPPKSKKLKKSKEKSNTIKPPCIPPLPPSDWDRCHAYLPNKHRYCRQLPNANSRYCGNHSERDVDNNTQDPVNSNPQNRRQRVPCPMDPSHSIWEDQAARHIKLCPATKAQQHMEQQAYYRKDFNGGGHGSLSCGGEKDSSTANNNINNNNNHPNQQPPLEWAKRLAVRILTVHQQVFAGISLDPSEIPHLTLRDIEDALPLQDLSQPELDAGLEHAIASYRIRSGGPKHLQQQASLLGHLRTVKGLRSARNNNNNNNNESREQQPPTPSNKTVFLELGAGRGMAGLIAAGAFVASGVPDTSLILVEKASSRSKAETVLRNHTSDDRSSKRRLHVEGVRQWLRIHCDLAHVHMPTVLQQFHATRDASCPQSPPSSSSFASTDHQHIQSPPNNQDTKASPTPSCDIHHNKHHNNHNTNHNTKHNNNNTRHIIALAKHLCGVGTDLALKALYPVRHQLEACVMATCCHGICDWKDYVGRDYLRQLLVLSSEHDDDDDSMQMLHHFGQEEFELMKRWSSGTVLEERCSNHTNGNAQKKTLKETARFEENTHTMPSLKEQQRPLGMKEVASALHLSCGAQGLGRACQRLIDYGRREYLSHELFADTNLSENEGSHNSSSSSSPFVDLCYYVPSSVTPQNAVLIAKRQQQH